MFDDRCYNPEEHFYMNASLILDVVPSPILPKHIVL
jgi:hypothetical protein